MFEHEVVMLVSDNVLGQRSFLGRCLVSVAVKQSCKYFLHYSTPLVGVHIAYSISEDLGVSTTSRVQLLSQLLHILIHWDLVDPLACLLHPIHILGPHNHNEDADAHQHTRNYILNVNPVQLAARPGVE